MDVKSENEWFKVIEEKQNTHGRWIFCSATQKQWDAGDLVSRPRASLSNAEAIMPTLLPEAGFSI